jgi:DNA-binding NtrC family response regulator
MTRVGQGMRVLIVDDEPMVRDVLARYLTRSGFIAESAGDGEAAIAAFDALRPDLVLLDLMLPRIDGLIRREGHIRTKGKTLSAFHTEGGGSDPGLAGLAFHKDWCAWVAPKPTQRA